MPLIEKILKCLKIVSLTTAKWNTFKYWSGNLFTRCHQVVFPPQNKMYIIDQVLSLTFAWLLLAMHDVGLCKSYRGLLNIATRFCDNDLNIYLRFSYDFVHSKHWSIKQEMVIQFSKTHSSLTSVSAVAPRWDATIYHLLPRSHCTAGLCKT